ncbi:alpha/beta hydrolase [Nocardia alni]|uniref:alpha/beta hydrolase n=1 Tax=Nocardia alni TaxID=2815723 RepID=UPI001C244935|nr:DUF3887 domain-containing protein [Nocardia alni]
MRDSSATTADRAAFGIAVVDLLRAGRFAEVYELFGPKLRQAVSVDTLGLAWSDEVDRRGHVVRVEDPTTEAMDGGLVRVIVPVTLEHGSLAVRMAVDEQDRLAGFLLAPPTEPWDPPHYARRKRFTEQDVRVGAGPLAVPGTLTMPRLGVLHRLRRTGVPGVVLLAGGGPFDRDETSGRNKPLKDIAWGLADRGVAALRFDKVTYTHAAAVADIPGFTMTDEYVPHAVSAAALLRAHPSVDPDRVYVLGHSMGGKVAPRVAAAAPAIAGLIVLAGDTQPMHHSAVRVARYLAGLNPAAAPSADLIAAQANLVDSPNLSADTPATDLPFGFSGSYWLDQRAYDPVALAASLHKPMFIAQGGRDYQVTVEHDLAGWRTGLSNHPNVTIRVYDAANHLFFAGTGPSTPAEYDPPQHVAPTVITDIADWIGAVTGTATSH